MLKDILKMEGAQVLDKAAQMAIQGGNPADRMACEQAGGYWNCYYLECGCLMPGGSPGPGGSKGGGIPL